MHFNIENLKLLNVLHCVSAPKRVYQNRPSHALVFRRSGSIEYRFGNKTVPLLEGQVMLIPEGTTFTVTQLTPGISRYTVINFRGALSLTEPLRICPQRDLSGLYARLDRSAAIDPEREPFALCSHFYWILSQLFEAEKDYRSSATLHLLDPAVDFLQSHLFDPDLKVGMLHSLCGVSDTYFRSLFAARFGVSPKKHLLNRRLSHAKALLDSGECGSIADVATLAGFDDALYFSKVFKVRYGMSPSQYQKSHCT